MRKINAKEILIGEDCYIGENVEINVLGKFELGRCSVILDGWITDISLLLKN